MTCITGLPFIQTSMVEQASLNSRTVNAQGHFPTSSNDLTEIILENILCIISAIVPWNTWPVQNVSVVLICYPTSHIPDNRAIKVFVEDHTAMICPCCHLSCYQFALFQG